MIRSVAFIVFSVIAFVGCTTPTRVIRDADTNYNFVFPQMPDPKPEIVNSRLERIDRYFLGLIPLYSVNGEWEFELTADSQWVAVLRRDFKKIQWDQISYSREVPAWFNPSSERFTVWHLHPTSYVAAHLFVERNPEDESRVHVFIRRH